MTTCLDRREFLVRTAGLTFTLAFATPSIGSSRGDDTGGGALRTAWVTIHPDDTITIMSAATELGQGSMTALPLILAEEMDADWSKVRVEESPSDDRTFANPRFGIMYTAGSSAVLSYYMPLRLQGAKVRRVLLDAVAALWGVPRQELSTRPNIVTHALSGRQISYGKIASLARVPDPLPEVGESDLKAIGDFRYIGGAGLMRVDLPGKVNGTAQYSIDARLSKMLYAAVLRAPIEGAAPASIDDRETLRIRGVTHVVPLPYGVGVLAATIEAAFEGKRKLKVTWTKTSADAFDSDEALERYVQLARDVSTPGMISDQAGDAVRAMAQAETLVQAEYRTDYSYHAQMEPLNSVASVNEAGDAAEIWAGTQAPTTAIRAAARALDTTPDRIVLHRSLCGGAFGRRGHPDQEFLVDSVLLSRFVRCPVKVIWTREDDVHNGRFRPATGNFLQAGLDANGNLTAWRHRVVAEASLAFMDPARYEKRKRTFEMADCRPYDFPNRLVDFVPQTDGMRLSALRGVGEPPKVFVVESFLDEVARKSGSDPVEFRLRLLSGAPRAQAVLRLVAEMSRWHEPRSGRGVGVCLASDTGGTVGAMVVEVSVGLESGVVRVHKVWAAVDVGVAVQPDTVVAQVEGAIVQGVGVALSERVSMRTGVVEQNNFYDYLVPRMGDAPEIEVRLLATRNSPSGAGEIGCSVTGAVSNAVAAATGIRVRHMPLLPERVLEALRRQRRAGHSAARASASNGAWS